MLSDLRREANAQTRNLHTLLAAAWLIVIYWPGVCQGVLLAIRARAEETGTFAVNFSLRPPTNQFRLQAVHLTKVTVPCSGCLRSQMSE